MDDMISRQAAIDAVCDYCEYFHNEKVIQSIKGIPSVQPEQSDTSEFWRKRADYYSDMCLNLVGEMGKGVKIKSVKISENGIEFIKEQPSVQPQSKREWYQKGYEAGQKSIQPPRWIPVTERLPEEDIEVLTYDSSFGITFDSLHCGKWRKHPVAWMPLPEPWRGGQE